MTGAELKLYLERRLREEDAVFEGGRPEQLYDALTDARDLVLQEIAEQAPILVRALVSLEADADGRTYTLPEETLDPYQWLFVRRAGDLEEDYARLREGLSGHYEQTTLREIRIRRGLTITDDLEAYIVPMAVDIDEETEEAEIGVPTTFHRVVGKLAAVLIHTQGEEDSANRAMALFQKEIDRLMGLSNNLNRSAGYGLRDAFAGGFRVG